MERISNKPQNLDRLINLIRLAKGDRSIRTYAEMSGISASNLSRILNGKLAKTPSKEMLERITSEEAQPQNGITLEDLLIEAGYQDRPLSTIQADPDFLIDVGHTDYIIECSAPDDRLSSYKRILYYYMFLNQYQVSEPATLTERQKHFTAVAPGIIFHYLTSTGIKFQIEPFSQNTNEAFGDLIIQTVEENDSKEWHFEFTTTISLMHLYNLEKDRILYPLLGRLSMFPPDKNKKYSLVTDIDQFSDELQRYVSHNSLKANFSVILIDIAEVAVIKETIVSTYEA